MSAIGDKLKGTGSRIGNKLNSGNSNYEQTKRVLNKMAQGEVAKSQEQPKYSFNPEIASAAKQMVNSRVARTTATSLPKIIEQKKAEREEQERWDSLSLGEKISDPFKTAEANRKHGALGIEESQAWSNYRNKQDQETLAKAQEATKAREEFELSNDRVGKGNAFTKDFAGYIPQLLGQTGAGISNAAGGAVATGTALAGTAALLGQAGPQIAVPEEIATVPAAFITGAKIGGKGGYVAGVANYSYDLMAGSAYKSLLDMGVPNEIALELSGDEALINSLIEGGGAVVDLITLGIGKLGTKGASTAAKKVAQNKLLAAAKAYGINLVTEPLEEGAQQIVSIETQKKAAEKSGIERNVTEAQDKQSILDSMQAGFNIAAISGLGNAAGNVATNAVSNKIAENRQSLYKTQQAMETYKNLSPYSKYQLQKTDTKISSKDVKAPQRTMSPEGGKIYVDPQGVAVDSRNYVAPRTDNIQTENYSPVNARQVLQGETLPRATQVKQTTDTELKLPTTKTNSVYQAAKGNVDVKIANRLMDIAERTNARVEGFYNENPDIEGSYKDGVIRINVNSEKAADTIFAHEFTHHLESTNAWEDVRDAIINSNTLYNMLSEQGINIDEYKQQIKDTYAANGVELKTDLDVEKEIVAKFVENNLMKDEKTIVRMINENPSFMQRLKNFWDDLVVRFKGSAEEKELRRIQNIYNKAFAEAQKGSTQTTETKYSIGEPPKGYTRLYRGLTQEFDKNYDRRKLDNVNGYESWTDSYELAKAYGDNVYYIDIPTNEIKQDVIDNDSTSETYGDRNLIYFHDKKVGLKGKSGNEYMLYTDHDNYPSIEYKKANMESPNTDNQGRKLSQEQQDFFKDSKVRDENDNLLVMYHGTPQDDFFEFDLSFSANGNAFFFTSAKDMAQSYGKDIKQVYIDAKNPLIIDAKGQNGSEIKAFFNEGTDEEFMEKHDTEGWAKYAKNNGYDGVVFKNLYDYGYAEDIEEYNSSAVVAVFNPNQIKNVDNLNPTQNPDIRYSIETDKQASTPKRYLSEHANTLLESGVTLPETRDVIAKMVEQGTLTHERITDKDAQAYAEKYIIENGFEDAVQHWNHLIKSNKEMSKEELALGQMIYNNAEQARDVNLVKKMIADLVAEGTTAGRNLQAMSMVKRLTPDGRLYALERSVQKLNQQYRDEIGKKFKDIEIPNDLAEALLKSKDQKEIDANVEKIQQYIADQIPATWKDKLNAWRYLAMLGNTRTHIRNLAGNAVFIPAIEIKNSMALVGEKTLPTAERTKAILTKKDRALLDFAENDFANNEQTIRGENKFDIASGVQEKRRIFDNKVLETLRKANFAALEKEDAMFLKYHYKRAMARAIKAKGLSLEQLKSGSAEMNSKLSEIRNYAINEAQKATYRDFNALAKWISNNKSRLKRNAAQSKGYRKAGYELAYAGVEGLIPFTKTPANIVKRIVEYSPVNIAKGIVDMNTSVKNGDMSASQAIDELCSGITGTGIVGLGILLASLGFITGGGEDKQKEEQFESLKGNQNYALKIGNKTYTIDWAAPSAVPLFVGVEIFNSLKNSENADVMGSFVKIVDPVFEMSMLQGINSALSAYGSDNAIGKAVSNMFQSYLGQYVPSLFGAVARTVDPVRRTTYADKNKMLPTGLQTFTQKQLQKIPVASTTLPTYKDQFGRDSRTDNLLIRIFSNFLSPGYLAEVKNKPVENELTRIYDKTGETDVLPSYASKSITVDGEKINFTYEQYEKFATTRGDIAYKNLEKLFADPRYKRLSDEDKVSAIRKIYTYANEVAKSKVSDYKLTKEKARIERQGNNYYREVLK